MKKRKKNQKYSNPRFKGAAYIFICGYGSFRGETHLGSISLNFAQFRSYWLDSIISAVNPPVTSH